MNINGSVTNIPIILDEHAVLPAYATPAASGADLHAAIAEPIAILPGQRMLIPTGLQVQIPVGFEIQIRPRSGLALKHGITVLNTPGTIDADYRGKIGVILLNTSDQPFVIQPKDRIAQAVLSPVVMMSFLQQEKLTETSRGSGGFGSTGLQKGGL